MRGKRKRWAAAMIAAVLCMSIAAVPAPIQVMAAQETGTTVVLTTQRCSIWSAPATTEENRVKYVDEGYPITIYPEVIQSESGDGKTFYRTVRGSYVLCKCVTDGDGTSAAEAGDDFGIAFLPMSTPPSLDRVGVRSERRELLSGGGYDFVLTAILIHDYDAFDNIIKTAIYSPDGTLDSYEAMEYDALGNRVKFASYGPDGTIRNLRISEYDAAGNEIKTTTYDADGSVLSHSIWGYDTSGNVVRDVRYYNGAIQINDGYEYDMQGNKTKYISYNADGTIERYTIYEYDALGNIKKATGYDADGSMSQIQTYHEDGSPDQWGLVRPDGSIYWVE